MRWTEQQVRDYNARMFGTSERSSPNPVAIESDLHEQILAECTRRQWIAIHCRMDAPSTIAKGIWDFTIIANDGRVYLIECKSATGKLTTEQHGLIAWASKLGHQVHVVRSFEGFIGVIQCG